MRFRPVRATGLLLGVPLIVGAVVAACGGSTHTLSAARPPRPAVAPTSTTSAGRDVTVSARSFRALSRMTPVRGFFVDNLLGHLDATLAVARSRSGGQYPPGTLLQLVPQEAMVKHRPGFDPATDDWEFFFLDVSPSGTKIVTRGAAEVVNRFGGNCAGCHSAADPKFDFVCEHNHGCAPLPVGDAVIRSVQRADPRPAKP
jgi:mono/diheme cytochrome c family protein